MSHKATSWAIEALDDSDQTPSARLVLILLADAHNGHSGDCFPSLVFLMRKTGLSESAVKVAIRQLEAAGLLWREIIPHSDGKRTKGVQYNLNLEGVRVRTPSREEPPEGFADEPTGVRVRPPSKDNRESNLSSLRSESRARKTRLTEAFTLTKERIAKGVAKGLTEQEITHEFGKFQDHYIGNGTAWVCWDRCWSKWLRTAAERGPRKAALASGRSAPVTEFRIFERMHAHLQDGRREDGGDEVALPF